MANQTFVYHNFVVRRVIDGDTVEVEIDLGFRQSTVQRIRLQGVDTPERGQEGFKEATLGTEHWFNTRGSIRLITINEQSFNRWIGMFVTSKNEHLSDYLVNEGLGVGTDGN